MKLFKKISLLSILLLFILGGNVFAIGMPGGGGFPGGNQSQSNSGLPGGNQTQGNQSQSNSGLPGGNQSQMPGSNQTTQPSQGDKWIESLSNTGDTLQIQTNNYTSNADDDVTAWSQSSPTTLSTTDLNLKASDTSAYCAHMAQSGGLVKYDGGVCANEGSGYDALMATVNAVIDWIVNIALMIAAAVAFYGGFLYLGSAANPTQRTKAKKLFINVIIGLLIVFSAWFIVDAILHSFAQGGTTGNFSGLQK